MAPTSQFRVTKMKIFVVALLALASLASADPLLYQQPTVYGYLKDVAIPQAEKIRKFEEESSASRIVGGVPAAPGQYEYQAGLLMSMVGIEGTGVCGGSLVSANKVITAAHCWFDGIHQAWRVTVVLGSTYLFTGGTRLDTSVVVTHPNWFPALIRNDVAVIYLPNSVAFSNIIGPIALPSGSELNEDFAGETAIASGFGLTQNGGNLLPDQFLSHVSLNVITNSACSYAFPLILQPSNICTSGIGGGTCQGDSGGPLAITRNGKTILIGITSFGNGLFGGCDSVLPAAFARVTSFMDFFNSHL